MCTVLRNNSPRHLGWIMHFPCDINGGASPVTLMVVVLAALKSYKPKSAPVSPLSRELQDLLHGGLSQLWFRGRQGQDGGACVGGQRGLHAQISASRRGLQPGQARLGVDSSAPALSSPASPTVWCRKAARSRLGFEDPLCSFHCLTCLFVFSLGTRAKVGMGFSNPGRLDRQNSTPSVLTARHRQPR